MSNFTYSNELYHHGIKGQRWGVRRFQYENGRVTPAGRERYYGNASGSQSLAKTNDKHIKRASDGVHKKAARAIVEEYYHRKIEWSGRSSEIGKKSVDTFLESETAFYRIQSSDNFENFAFYATYKQHDIDEYAGLFGKNLTSRANAAAKAAEKQAKKSGLDEDIENAKNLREVSDNMKIYQLQIKSKDKLKIPSEDNAGRIVGELMKDSDFHTNLKASLIDSKEKMKRPSQQMLFKEALNVMEKDPTKLTSNEKSTLYKALNLSLTNHNEQEQAMQAKFYGAMKKEGYSALLDLNDKSYSSYHAHSPVIVFDTDKVKLQSVTQMNSDKIETLYKKYNKERIAKDIPEQVIGNLSKYSELKISQIEDYVNKKQNDYLSG